MSEQQQARKMAQGWLSANGSATSRQPKMSVLYQLLRAHPQCPEPLRDQMGEDTGKVKKWRAIIRYLAPLPRDERTTAKRRRAQRFNAVELKFYDSIEWRKLRYRVLVFYGRRCMCCGATAADGTVIHVDHIKPRSRFPALELVFSNLQVLCEDCNIGKSAEDYTDFRPKDITPPMPRQHGE